MSLRPMQEIKFGGYGANTEIKCENCLFDEVTVSPSTLIMLVLIFMPSGRSTELAFHKVDPVSKESPRMF